MARVSLDETGSGSGGGGGWSLLTTDRAHQARSGRGNHPTAILDALFPRERQTPIVTILDGHPHTLAFLASVTGTKAVHLGVTGFGQSGDLESVYRYHGLDTDSIVRAALDLTHR